MNEFLRIAEEQDLLSLKKTAASEKNPYGEDEKTIREKRQKSPEKNIIEVAHPEPVYVAEARGDGGLVENQIEQQKNLIEMLNKMPTGSLVGRYASAMLGFKKMADDCDDVGMTKVADVLADLTAEFIRMATEDLCDACGCKRGQELDDCKCKDCKDSKLPLTEAPSDQ